MKTKTFLALAGAGVLQLLSVNATAGLNIADTPVFLTEVLPPNVFLTPVYARGANEVSPMDMDWSLADRSNAQNRAGYAWYSFIHDYYRGYPHRVVSWPNVFLAQDSGNQNVLDSCEQLYGDDVDLTASSVIKYSMDVRYNSGNAVCYGPQDAIARSKAGADFVDIPFVLPTDSKLSYYNGMALYARSDKNMLYYHDSVTYDKWPGSNSYVDYGNGGDVSNPLYHPLSNLKYSGIYGSNTSKVFLNTATNPQPDICDNSGNPLGSNGVCSVDYTPGAYWTYNAGEHSSIADVASYTQHGVSNPANFATWFTYWRSADLATRSILGNFVDQLANVTDEISGVRLWLGYNSNTTLLYDNRVQPDVSRVFSTIYSTARLNGGMLNGAGHSYIAAFLKDNNGVPSSAFLDNPTVAYQKNYHADTPADYNPARSCRRNYQIIVSPDYTNLRWAWAVTGNAIGLLPSPLPSYSNADSGLGDLYADSYPNTWSDLGAAVWNTDLSALLQNNLLPTALDPQTTQHLSLFLVAPTAAGLVFNNPGSIHGYDDAIAVLKNNKPGNWVNPQSVDPVFQRGQKDTLGQDVLNSLNQAASIDDLWHMVLNSRGFFYQSQDMAGMTHGLLNALHDILVNNISGSSVSTNTTSIQNGSQIYQATVESNWKGHLRAFDVTTTTTTVNNVTYDMAGIAYDPANPVWDLAQTVSAQDWNTGRNIVTYNGTGAVTFTWNSLDATVQGLLTASMPAEVTNPGAYGNDLLNYLRGNPTCEDGASTSCASGVSYVFRRRNIDRSNHDPYTTHNPNGRNVLGDISNSNPWYVSAPMAGMSDLDAAGYNAYRVAHQGRPGVLYVGANDGMLHAVEASDGKELFAYIPSFVLGNLPQLADLHYSHQYTVDGSPFAAEVDMGVNMGGWKTVLAGGLNKGGKGYYLLDVTNPLGFSASSVLWEFGHPDMNYSYNLPVPFPAGNQRSGQSRQIVRMNDGKWAMIVGNGYPEAASRQACLFIVYLAGPSGSNKTWVANTDYHELCVGATGYSGDHGLDTNGLSTPTPYDANGDGMVDFIYAGDLNGNLWKFDVSAKNPQDANHPWAPAHGTTTPSFVAKNDAGVRQPIVSPPEVTPYGTGTLSGQLILFGTGKYLENGDRLNGDVQSFYGVWDTTTATTTLDRSSLLQQTFDESTTARTQAAKTPVPYCDKAGCSGANSKFGWYWDMPVTGERLTGRVTLLSGLVFFNTFFPQLDGGQPDPCQSGGDGWLMGLNAANGYMEDTFSVFDVNHDRIVDSNDAPAAGLKVGAAMGGTDIVHTDSGSGVAIFSPTDLPTAPGSWVPQAVNLPTLSGRVSWVELSN